MEETSVRTTKQKSSAKKTPHSGLPARHPGKGQIRSQQDDGKSGQRSGGEVQGSETNLPDYNHGCAALYICQKCSAQIFRSIFL